jgi:NADPH:quinone reductase-like Zn-dependent oxidoreductase
MPAHVLTQLKQPLRKETRPDPVPRAREAVVQLQAAALNRRDYWITQGLYPGIKLPVVPGSDGAGVVRQLGPGVDPAWQDREVVFYPGIDWGEDQTTQGPRFRVLGMPDDGTFATAVRVPACLLFPKPPHLNWHEAAALPLAGVTAWRAVFTQGRLQAGQHVLITGVGGGVAALALQLAVAAGARAWVTSSSPRKIQQAVGLGAQGGLDYTHAGWAKELLKLSGPFSLIVDSAGGEGYAQLLELAAPGGRVVSYGATAGRPPTLDLFRVFWKQLHLVGSTLGSPQDFAALLEFVTRHQIRPVVDRVFPLDDVNTALDTLAQTRQFGKLVLDCSA